MNRFETRLQNLRKLLLREGVDAFLITSPINVSYFTGHAGDDCNLYISFDEAIIITDFRYQEMAESIPWLKLELLEAGNNLFDVVARQKEIRIGLEKDHILLVDYLNLQEKVHGKCFNPIEGLVEELRMVKDEYEIECTKKAADITCKTFDYMLNFIKPGLTEIDCANELEYQMKMLGAEGSSFNTILISGTKTSMPHGVPNRDVIHNNCFVTIDFGCKVNGYCSDMTRTFALGSVTEKQKEVYNIVLEAQLAACEGIKADMTGQEIDAIARNIINKAGYGKYFGHSLGHGTGLEIHELPRYSPEYKLPIKEGSVVSIEPGIYLPGEFGVRIEDLALVTKNGIINLEYAPKELLII